jgi:cyclopropane fatty-acyl-phospholipid synthase-like methyltransferase
LESHWFETFFKDIAVDCWVKAMSPEATRAEADFIEKALGVSPGARLLDIPCGHGRHSLELSRRGYRMTGVDLSEDAIRIAREEHSDVEWKQGDMRTLSREAEFDGAFCFGNSFAYLDCENAERFLHAIATALKPGAHFVIDTGMAAESILPTRQQRRWFRLDDIFMLSENRYNTEESRLDIDYTFIRNGVIETRPSSSYVFTIAEHRRMLRRAGFEIVAMESSLGGDSYELGSPRLILTACKIRFPV